eukprot:GHRR01008112.1.p1 GENE.GHRR01008112.1~~GHRR01008112.1.p1  ORF type:complete len:967 (+),score=418.47 GHRR01008112.1:837-3737(+)
MPRDTITYKNKRCVQKTGSDVCTWPENSMGDLSADEFVERLQQCLQFLANHGFKKAADAVFEQLDGKTVLDQELRQETPSSASHDSPDFADQPSDGERRSRSAGAVLRHEPPEEYDAARESQEQGPWQPGSTLTTRLSGSQRLYEDPDIDEYNCMEDVGYIRQPVPHQHEFVLRQLDLQDNDHEAYLQHASSQHHSNNDSPLSDSGSSSASLSSPGMSSSKPYHSATSLLHDEYQQQDHQQGLLLRTHTSQSAPTGDAAWDSGPAGITFAEPVTTPTKEGRHSTASEPKQSLSRVESLSNSFIDELESCQGDEAGSITGDISTPALRRSTQTALRGSSSDPGQIAAGQQGTNTHEDTPTPSEAGDVIDLSPPSPPPDCAADAAIDFSNIFELGLRGSSRTSSVEVLYGSTKGWSETNSEVGDADSRPQLQGAEAGGGTAGPFGLWAAFGGVKKQKSASKLQPPPQLEEQQQYQQQQLSAQQQQQHQDLQQLGQGESSLQQQEQQQLEQPLAAAEPSQQQEQQLQSSSYGVSGGSGPGTPDKQTAYGGTAATAGSLGVGFGFSFPTTSPSAVDAAVHEERAERVFSSWASNHSRCGADAAGASDDEDSSSSKPAISIPSSASGSAEGQMLSEGLWELPATPMAMVPVAPAAAAVSQSTIAATTPVCAGSHTGSGAGDPAVDVSTEAAAAAVLSDAKIPPVAVGVAPTAQHPGSSGAAVNELHRLGSSSDAAATQAAAAAPALAEAATQPAAEVHKAAAADEEPGNNDRGAMRPHSTAVEGEPELLQREGSGYNESMAAPATDADMASTETGGFSGSGELPQPRYVIDEAGNLLYEYDSAYVEARYETFDLRIIHRRRRTGFEDSKDFPIRKNDLIAGRYQVMDFLGSAAFSQAVQALDTATGALVCLKIIKNNKDYFDQSLDEIKLLRYVNGADPEDEHHIVRLYDFFYYKVWSAWYQLIPYCLGLC